MRIVLDLLLLLVMAAILMILPILLLHVIFKIYDHIVENNKKWIEVKKDKK